MELNMIECACGCGELITDKDERNRPRRYVKGHHVRNPRTEKQLQASRNNIENGRPETSWNKGRTYVISSRIEYAHRGAWMKAMKRLFGDACMRCGWNEASCDTHHLSPRGTGGKNTIENGIILCPNCHRLAEVGKVSLADLQAIRAQAVEICDRI